MPMYDYRCEKCGAVKTFMLPMGHHNDGKIPTHKDIEHEDKACPVNKKPLSRVYNPTGFILKGEGWTEKSSQTSEKNKKLKKLYNDSKMSNMKPM